MPRTVRIVAFIWAAAAALALAAPAAQTAIGSGALTARISPTGLDWGTATLTAGAMPMPPGQPTGIGWD